MNRWRTVLVAALALWSSSALSASSAFAEARSRAAVFDWSGFYLGADLGTLRVESDYLFFNPALRSNSEPRGTVAGMHLGYRWQLPSSFVIGLEGDFWLSSAEQTKVESVFFASHVAITRGASLRGVFGKSFGPTLFYATAGSAFAKIDSCTRVPVLDDICDPITILSGWRNGWTAGAGIAHALSKNWILRAEYLYSDFGRETIRNNGLSGGGLHVDVKAQTYRIGVSRRFGN